MQKVTEIIPAEERCDLCHKEEQQNYVIFQFSIDGL